MSKQGQRESSQRSGPPSSGHRSDAGARSAARAEKSTRTGEAPEPPEPLTVPVLDAHTHLDIVGGDPFAALAAARAVGVDRIVQVGVDVASSRWSVRLAEQSTAVLAAVALHPNDAPLATDLDEALREIEKLAGHERVRAIGETGLDQFRTGEDGRATQEHSFRAHIAIAKRYGRTLMIHDRDAHADVLRVLDEEGAPDRVMLHCFSGDAQFARECVRRGYFLSFAGTVTFANARALHEAVAVTPLESMLVETDAPFLTPTPYRGRPNAPYLVPLTVRALAARTGHEVDAVCTALSANGERAFGPWQ